jgi:hypothetical protein
MIGPLYPGGTPHRRTVDTEPRSAQPVDPPTAPSSDGVLAPGNGDTQPGYPDLPNWTGDPREVGNRSTWPPLSSGASRGIAHRGRLGQRPGRRCGVTILTLACLLVVALAGAASAVIGYEQYKMVRSEASDGLKYLRRAQAIVTPILKHPALPDAATLTSLDADLTQAQQDFARARQSASGGLFTLAGHLPAVGGPVTSAVALVTAADEACQGGLSLTRAVEALAPVLHSGFLAGDAPSPPAPTLTSPLLRQVTAQVEGALADFTAAVASARSADLSVLPASLVSASQIASLRDALAQWPTTQLQLARVAAWLHLAPSLLGVAAPERFLVEFMDRGELRPTGGFIGSYGVLTIQGGKIQPFTLNDVYTLDVPYLSRVGNPAPPRGYGWWPFGGWGLRDSNLSGDFPTSARLGMQALQTEGGPVVRGVIAITAPVMERVLGLVGAVPLPEYGVTVTAHNLEPLIRLYTETNSAAAGTDLPADDQLTSIHERFTALLGRALMARLHHLSSQQLVQVAQIFLSSLPSKDPQLYFRDSTAEGLLRQAGRDAAMVRGSQDGVTLVDANTEANRANLFTSVAYADAVTVDAQGTATHQLTITYTFASARVPSMVHYLFGRDYYRTYLRVYAHPAAQLTSHDGFNGGDVRLGESDLPGRQMWGGYVLVQDGVPYTLRFTWSVPGAATRDASGHLHYTLVYQHQAESPQSLHLTVSFAGDKSPALIYSGPLSQDRLFQATSGH